MTDDGLRSIQDYYAMVAAYAHRYRQQNEKLRLALYMMIQVHGAVDFDTPEDNGLRDRAIATARLAMT